VLFLSVRRSVHQVPCQWLTGNKPRKIARLLPGQRRMTFATDQFPARRSVSRRRSGNVAKFPWRSPNVIVSQNPAFPADLNLRSDRTKEEFRNQATGRGALPISGNCWPERYNPASLWPGLPMRNRFELRSEAEATRRKRTEAKAFPTCGRCFSSLLESRVNTPDPLITGSLLRLARIRRAQASWGGNPEHPHVDTILYLVLYPAPPASGGTGIQPFAKKAR